MLIKSIWAGETLELTDEGVCDEAGDVLSRRERKRRVALADDGDLVIDDTEIKNEQ